VNRLRSLSLEYKMDRSNKEISLKNKAMMGGNLPHYYGGSRDTPSGSSTTCGGWVLGFEPHQPPSPYLPSNIYIYIL
jgi:hypothetical protein